jgi:four helix bundle protein
MKNYQQLIVWEKALKFAGKIQESIRHFPIVERDTLGKQMSRAGISIVSNIAEGKHRKTKKDYAHFVNIAYSSAKELEAQIQLAAEFKCITRINEKAYLLEVDEILRMLWGLQKKLIC